MLSFYMAFMAVFGICGTFVTNLAIFRQTEWSLQVMGHCTCCPVAPAQSVAI